MENPALKIVIVGGGAAGWITAGLIAARYKSEGPEYVKVTVIESPDIPIIGVGEGTWPSMRSTLRKMGVSEREFVRSCNASFKQGSKFRGWRTGDVGDYYYHPFHLPEGFSDVDMGQYWRVKGSGESYSEYICAQEGLCEANLAPKLMTSPDFAGLTNYGYHLDAGRFSSFLRDHTKAHLGVIHIADTMVGLKAKENGDILAIETKSSGDIAGDLFIDCTGFRSLLLGGHFGVGVKSKSDFLFPDTALAVQVPYGEGDPIQSTTVATAQPAGWIWDVSLSCRRGIGYVYSSNHMEEDAATDCVRKYVGLNDKEFGKLSVRKIGIGSGHRDVFWKQNCIAVGLSAGFLEPLEASALMLIETSANMIANALSAPLEDMEKEAHSFNRKIHKIWESIIHFLKLHYCLSEREEPFWQDNRARSSVPDALQRDLNEWRIGRFDSGTKNGTFDIFPAASYQYVLYGMGPGALPAVNEMPEEMMAACQKIVDGAKRDGDRFAALLPSNKELLDAMNETVSGE